MTDKDNDLVEPTLRFDLVITKPIQDRYEALIQDSVTDPLDRFNIHSTFVEVKQIKSDWSSEVYIIVREDKDVGYFCIDKYPAESVAGISFYVKKQYQNNGVLTGCVPFIGTRVFNELGYRRIQASALSTNLVAIKAYGKWLSKEGVRRGSYEYNGKQVDRHLYGTLKKDSMWAPGGEYAVE